MDQSLSLRQSKVKKSSLAKPNPRTLLTWYDQYRRILPWRALPGRIANPYYVWLSEIMLQQTTVGAVGPYFQKFLVRWPTIEKLARAPLGEVLKMWAGLGYYRRAHMLHACAKKITREYGGEFPQSEDELRALPGFGPYTTAAVAAIAFDQRSNVVDGNVERVMARVFAIRTPLPEAKPKLRDAAASLLPTERYGDYAQALMDLGATICTPRNPKCDLCPWRKACRAHALGIQDKLPARLVSKAKPIRRGIAFFLMDNDGKVLLRRRPEKGLLGGMMEIPSSEWRETEMPSLTNVQAPVKGRWRLLPGHIEHVFSHFTLQLAVAALQTSKYKSQKDEKWVAGKRLKGEALPSVMLKIVKHAAENAVVKT